MYPPVSLPTGTALCAAIRQAQFLGHKAFGVICYDAGYGIHVNSKHFEEMMLPLQPDNAEPFLYKKFEISRLAIAMGKQNLQDFIEEWRVHHCIRTDKAFGELGLVHHFKSPKENCSNTTSDSLLSTMQRREKIR